MKTLIPIMMSLSASCMMASAEWQPLWPGEAPGGAKPVVIQESEGEGGRLADIAVPQYEVYLPEASRRSGAAVVILPGGGYTILAASHEGRDYATWLNERGIVAVVAKYRVSGKDEAGYQFPVPLLDARRAIRVTRARAKEWGVDPAKVGVMGSSAGGHLASMCATLWNETFEEEGKDAIDQEKCRPDFAVLVYPVIAMSEPWGHTGSKRRLLGNSPDAALVARVSTEKRVDKDTPPCFLIHAADDGGVPVRNSLEFAARCAENKVPVVFHVFAQGGHGFGLNGKGGSETWPSLMEQWLGGLNLTRKPWIGDVDE
jgi:acetyl esterase/lipase